MRRKKLKIGLIGGGRIGKVHGENIQKYIPDAEVSIFVNRTRREELVKWAEDLEIPRISSDPEEIFSDPEIDAVCICSATETHIEYIIRAAKAGKHIFCEKPVHWDIGRIKEALEAVREAGVKLQIGFVRRFDRSHRAVREAVASGKLGAPYMIKACSRDPEPPSMEYIQGSGGIFLDMMIHDFDMARYLSGSEVTEVYAMGACLVDPRFADCGDVDTALVTLKFANGAMGVIDNCRRSSYGYDQAGRSPLREGLRAGRKCTGASGLYQYGRRHRDGETHLVFPGEIQRCFCGRNESLYFRDTGGSGSSRERKRRTGAGADRPGGEKVPGRGKAGAVIGDRILISDFFLCSHFFDISRL